MVKAFELRKMDKETLLKKLADLRKELSELHVAKVTDGAASKVARIHGVRKSIARVLTIYNTQQKAGMRELYKNAKFLPIDLRAKKTRAKRRELTARQQSKVTRKAFCKSVGCPAKKFVIKV
jgi:large subunit ribosomal protein L35e